VTWAHLGAFASGVAAILSAIVSLHLERRRAERACDKRVAELRQALREGFEMGGNR
jgi:hypothetical protein